MGRDATKAAGNPWYQARKKAAEYDDRLCSRESAAEQLGMSVSSLADAELGNTKFMPVDTAALIENKAGLEPDEQFYGVHLIDDISMSDCRLVSTDSLEADGLVETLEGVYAGLKKSLSDGGASDDFERK